MLMVVHAFPPQFSGIGDYTAHLGGALARLGVRVAAVAERAPGLAERAAAGGVQVWRLAPGWGLPAVRQLCRLAGEQGPGSVVNLQYPGFGRSPWATLMPLAIRANCPRARVVVTLHEFRAQRRRWRLRAWPLLLAAHGVILVDAPDRNALRPYLAGRRLPVTCIPMASTIVPVPVRDGERAAWQAELGFGAAGPIITHFGDINPEKGFLELARTVEDLRRDGVPLRFLVLGRLPVPSAAAAYRRAVERFLAGGQQEGWVRHRDRLDPHDVSRFLHASQIAAFPYPRGARSNRTSLLAAVEHGLAVLTTTGIDTPPGLTERLGVVAVPSHDRQAFKASLRELATVPLQREEACRRARAGGCLSWETVARRTLSFCRALEER
ncbi:MAG: glycosyltransferase family 4 protein [Candidatus Latescibacterota bacterium]